MKERDCFQRGRYLSIYKLLTDFCFKNTMKIEFHVLIRNFYGYLYMSKRNDEIPFKYH